MRVWLSVHCVSVCICLPVCLDSLVCLFVPSCCHSLMAGSFCTCCHHLGFSCMFGFHNLFGRLPSFASCPASRFCSIGLCPSVGVLAHTLGISLTDPPIPPQNLGPSILAGVAFMVLLIPLNGAVAVKMRALQVGALNGLPFLPRAPGQGPGVGGGAFTNLGPLSCLADWVRLAISHCHKP